MTNLPEWWQYFRFISDPAGYSPEERELLERFLSREYALREQKKREHLLDKCAPSVKECQVTKMKRNPQDVLYDSAEKCLFHTIEDP
jgi:hypothetical protein